MKSIHILIISILLLSVQSCKFDYFDKYEEINESSVSIQIDSIGVMNNKHYVFGNIDNKYAKIDDIGICYTTNGQEPDFYDNQIIVSDFSASEFQIEIPNCNSYATYKVKSFVIYNTNNFYFSKTTSYTPSNTSNIELPSCSINENYIYNDGIAYNFNGYYNSFNLYQYNNACQIEVYSDYNEEFYIYLEFPDKIESGVYSTYYYGIENVTDNYVKASIVFDGYYEYDFKSGGKVYVEFLDNGLLSISFCDTEYYRYSSNKTFNGNFTE